MNFSHFFIRRPIFAGVLSIIVFVMGLIAMWKLPISEYPEVVPPTVVVQASTYTGLRDLSVISAVALGTAILMWVTFRSAGTIGRRLGPIGLNIVTRVMGILVTATAFGLLARGIGGLLPGLMN